MAYLHSHIDVYSREGLLTVRNLSRETIDAITTLVFYPSVEGSVLPSNLESPVTRTNGPRGRDQFVLPSRELFFRHIRLPARFHRVCTLGIIDADAKN